MHKTLRTAGLGNDYSLRRSSRSDSRSFLGTSRRFDEVVRAQEEVYLSRRPALCLLQVSNGLNVPWYQLDGGERMRTRGEGGLEKIGHIWYFTFCNLNGKQVRRSSKSHLKSVEIEKLQQAQKGVAERNRASVGA